MQVCLAEPKLSFIFEFVFEAALQACLLKYQAQIEPIMKEITGFVGIFDNQAISHVIDQEVLDYIMILVENRKTRLQVQDDLELFIGSDSTKFAEKYTLASQLSLMVDLRS